MQFKAADVVYHKPSKETWQLACVEGDYVWPCGWPETRARAEDCELKRSATDEMSLAMLKRWYKQGTGYYDCRVGVAWRTLEKLNAGQGEYI